MLRFKTAKKKSYSVYLQVQKTPRAYNVQHPCYCFYSNLNQYHSGSRETDQCTEKILVWLLKITLLIMDSQSSLLWAPDRRHILTTTTRAHHLAFGSCINKHTAKIEGLLWAHLTKMEGVSLCLSVCVLQLSWQPFIRLTSHSAGVLLRTQGSAV